MPKIILATTSPYRTSAFINLGIDFVAEGSNVDESQVPRDNPIIVVSTLARLKALAVAKNHPTGIVIGMDSVAYHDGQILEKPKSREEAFRRLQALSAGSHQFYTGVYMVDTATEKAIQRVAGTDISVRQLSEKEIQKYLDKDPLYATFALGYNPLQYVSASFINRIEGSYTNLLWGIPLEVVMEMLSEIGFGF